MKSPLLPRPGETKFDILVAVVDFCQQNSFGPSMEELRLETELASRSTVHYHLHSLIELDLIESDGRRRGIYPTKRGKNLVRFFERLHA